ncbi:hypothetical protein ALC62_12136, partial [Cyphomyrmex costatus]
LNLSRCKSCSPERHAPVRESIATFERGRESSAVISFVGWRERFAGINFHPSGSDTRAPIVNRANPLAAAPTFASQRTSRFSRVTEHGIQFVAVSPIDEREREREREREKRSLATMCHLV